MLVAVSRSIKNKPTQKEFVARKLNGTFENLDLTMADLGKEVSQGHALCAQHHKWRKKEHFLRAGFLAADIDHGLRIEDALRDSFVEQFGGLIYTSVSHTPTAHRFRIVFELEEPISDVSTMEAAYTGLSLKLGSDKSCTDACRMFFGSSGAKLYEIGGQPLPRREVDALVIRGKESVFAKNTLPKNTTGVATVHSRLVIDPETMVTDASGAVHRLVALPERVSIHCPVHTDARPSAFTLRSTKSGTPGVHCSTCNATFFIRSEGPYYDFDYELRALEKLKSLPSLASVTRAMDEEEQSILAEQEAETNDVSVTQNKLFAARDLEARTAVAFISEKFLPDVQTDADVLFVKSPKGSGKTEWLKQIVGDARKKRQSVLLIGHRQSLIMSTAARLGLRAYITFVQDEETGESRVLHETPTSHFAICVDSLPLRLEPRKHKYDIILIDEVEQVLAHLTSETLRDNRHDVLMLLAHYLQRAKKVYALDADLNRVTGICIPELLRPVKKTAFVVVNDWDTPKGTIHLYEDRPHLVDVLREHLSAGKRCFVCANSKRMILRLAHMLTDEFRGAKKLKIITSENSQTRDAQDFLLGLPGTCLQYDCVLVSPAVGTGVDITFPNGEPKIDSVFGFFGARVNTHFDIDQQLCRVRHPGSLHVWVSPERSSFSTYQKVIRTELLKTAARSFRKVGYTVNGAPQYSEADTMYATIFTEVMALRRASKNNFRENFCTLRKRSGWEIVEVPCNDAASQHGKEMEDTGRTLDAAARHDRLMQAEPISDDDYRALLQKSRRGSLSSDDDAKMRRYELERFYKRPISEELVERDKDGEFRRAIRMFELLQCVDEHLDRWWVALQRDTKVHQVTQIDANEARARKHLLVTLLSAADLFETGVGFKLDTIVTQDTLSAFIDACRKEKPGIERLLEMTLRRDLGTKAALQVGAFLRLLGLSLKRCGTKKQGDAKIYLYQLDRERLELVQAEVHRRSDPTAEAAWKALQDARFPDDPDFDRITSQQEKLNRPVDIADLELDRKAERYRETPEEAPAEPDF